MLDLDQLVQIGSARGGRKPFAPLAIEVVRKLGEDDLPAILSPAPLECGTSAVKTLRSSHHTLARLLAEGRRPGECSVITGYSQSRISILQNDPAFQELKAYYSSQLEPVYLNVHERLAQVGTDALEVIQERLDTDPDGFKNSELLAIVESTMDRSVAPAKGGPQARGGTPGPVAVQVTFVNHEAPRGIEMEGRVIENE
jgi:hypothetical protein